MVFGVGVFFTFNSRTQNLSCFHVILVQMHWQHCLNHCDFLEVIAQSFHCSKCAIVCSKIIIEYHICHNLIKIVFCRKLSLKTKTILQNHKYDRLTLYSISRSFFNSMADLALSNTPGAKFDGGPFIKVAMAFK